MNTTESMLSTKYQQKTDKQHILDNPDTYIGSIEEIDSDTWIYDDVDNKIIEKNIKYIPGLFKLFDEGIVNCRDHVIRMSQAVLQKAENALPVNNIEIKEESDNEDNTSDDEGVSCIPIYTNKKKLLWYNEDNQSVYEPEGDDSGEEIGLLIEISMEYHTINHNDKFYTVLNELNVKDKGNIYYCVLTDSLFDKELNFIGTRTKIKNNKYRFDFTK